jgi:hypothetical protein
VRFEVGCFKDERDMAWRQFIGGKGRWLGGASLHLRPSVGGQAMVVRGVTVLGAVVVRLGVQRKGKTPSGPHRTGTQAGADEFQWKMSWAGQVELSRK